LRSDRIGFGRLLSRREIAVECKPQAGQNNTYFLHLAPPFRFAAMQTMSPRVLREESAFVKRNARRKWALPAE
jgi:hypothetical protein